MKAPAFWQADGWPARLLDPVGQVLGRLVSRRARQPGTVVGVPVLCIGNPTLGGAGKTPVVLSLVGMLTARGRRPHVVTRGYGGRLKGPLRVDPAVHSAAEVGDEALLLAAMAPTWIGADRAASARAAVAAGADLILMDDGFQNPGLAKTRSWLVIDGPAGIGNGRVFPAGPLREPLADALARADAIVMIGRDAQGLAGKVGDLPVLRASIELSEASRRELRGRRVLAFAGIGRPGKFFDSLREIGAELAGTRGFPDHYPFTPAELAELFREAGRLAASLTTTAKDAARLGNHAIPGLIVARVELRWDDPASLTLLLDKVLREPCIAPPL